MRPGTQLRSTTCDTEVVVVKAARPDVVVSCGGAPMVDRADKEAERHDLDAAHANGSLLGKRYVLADELELLVTKPGKGSLAVDGVALEVKAAKPLPASD